jgi:hypothetical protein
MTEASEFKIEEMSEFSVIHLAEAEDLWIEEFDREL